MNEIAENSVYAILPSTNEDKQTILQALIEIDVSLTRIEAERDLIKEIADGLKEDFGLGKRLVNRLAATYHKGNAEEVLQQFEEYASFYDGVVGKI